MRSMKENKLLILVFILFLSIRLIPYIGNLVPTGYDAGLYLHVIKSFPFMPDWLIQSYYSALFFITLPIKFIGLQPNAFIVPFALAIQIFLFFSIFWIVRKLSNWKTALIAVFILSVSAIQIRAYWFFYLKYILSITFFLFFLSFLGKKSYFKATILGILTSITHLLTFGILLPVFCINIAISAIDRRKKIVSLGVVLLFTFLFYLPYFNQAILSNLMPTIANYFSVNSVIKENGGGTFYPIYVSLLLTALYLPLSIYGIIKTQREKKEEFKPLLITLILTILLVVIRASFFRRIFIITDIILIIYAAYGFSLIKEMKKFYIVVLLIFGLIFTLKTSDKLIAPQNLEEISNSDKIINNHYLVSTAKEDTAWLLGYTDAKVIAWGYGGYDTYWTNDQWETFFNKNYPLEQKRMLLNLLPKQTYIYIDDNTKDKIGGLLGSKYFGQISPHFYVVK